MPTAVEQDITELTIVVRREGRWLAATVTEMPEIQTQGRTLEEVFDNVRDAILQLGEARRQLERRGRR